MSTYEERLEELKKKYGMGGGSSAPAAPTSQRSKGSTFEERSAAMKQKWGKAPSGGVNFAPADQNQIAPGAPDFGDVPVAKPFTQPAGRARILEDGLNTGPQAPIKEFDFATAGAEIGAEIPKAKPMPAPFPAAGGSMMFSPIAPAGVTPSAEVAERAQAERDTLAQRELQRQTERLAEIKGNPDYLFAAIVEGRILPKDLVDVPAANLPWNRLAQNPESQWYKAGQKGLTDPEGAKADLLGQTGAREGSTAFQIGRGFKTGSSDALTLGVQRPDVLPQTGAERAGFFTGEVLGQIPLVAGAAVTGGAAAGGLARAAGIANPLALSAANAAGTGLTIETARQAAQGLARPQDFSAKDAAKQILSTTGEYALFGPAYEGLGIAGQAIGKRAPGLARAVQAVERVPIAGEVVTGGAKGAIAGGLVGVAKAAAATLATPEGRDAKSFVQTVLSNSKEEMSEELVEAIAMGIVRKFVPMNAAAVLATSQTLKAGTQATSEAPAQSAAPTAPAVAPAPPSPSTQATPPALDRAARLRTANPGMDEKAVLELVNTTGNLSDQEFHGFADRVGKPEAAAPAKAPLLDRVAALREKHPDLSEAFIQRVAKSEERLAVVLEKNPGISDDAARDAVQLGDILSDGDFRKYAALVTQPQEAAPKAATGRDVSMVQPNQAPATPTPSAVAAAPAPSTTAAPTPADQVTTKPLPKMGDNYVKPLNTYSDTLYRETSARAAFPFIKESNATDQGAMNEVFLANTPNLALGQGDNRGILMEFDAGALRGQVNTGKPAWQMAYDQGEAEFVGKNNSAQVYQEALRSVTVKADAKLPKADKRKLTGTLKALEGQGWTKTANEDGSVTYRRPQPATAPTPQPAAQAADNGTVPEASRPAAVNPSSIPTTSEKQPLEMTHAEFNQKVAQDGYFIRTVRTPQRDLEGRKSTPAGPLGIQKGWSTDFHKGITGFRAADQARMLQWMKGEGWEHSNVAIYEGELLDSDMPHKGEVEFTASRLVAYVPTGLFKQADGDFHKALVMQAASEGKGAGQQTTANSPAARPTVTGTTTTAKTERGTTVEAQYAVVDAGDLISSHDTGLRQDARYPQELQPRDRSRMASEDQINRIVGNLEPSFLGASPKASEGAPIVGNDMVVESGNGRVIALKRAYENSHANGAKYKTWLQENAGQFGLDAAAIGKLQNPVLVRVRQTEVDRAEFTRQANEQSVAAMSATEQAMSDAKKLEGGWMALFNPTDTGEIVHPGNRDFIRTFMDKVIGPSERGRYMTADGALSQEGINRIRNAVFAKAYGDPIAIEKLAESPDNNVRNITNAMLTAAGRVVQIKDGIADGHLHNLDISQEIAKAMQKLSELRESGQTVQQFLGQSNLFADEMSPLAKDVLDVLDRNKRSGKKITGILMAYADVVEGAGDPRQMSLFEQSSPTLAEVWAAAVNRAEESGSEVQPSIFGDPALRSGNPGEGSPQGGTGTQAGQGQGTRGEVTGTKGGTDAMRGGRPSLMPGGATAAAQVEPMRRLDIVKFLDKAFAPIRTGSFRGRGALGIFKVRENVIRTKLAEDLPVIAHEVGHHLDREFGLQDKSYDGELLVLGKATSPATAGKDYLRKEGVAEFMRLYLTDPAAALKQAHGYHTAFEAQMQAHPDIQETLLEARRMVDMWKNQSGKARILGAMSIGEKEAKRPNTFTQMYAKAVDELEPLRKIEEQLAPGQKLSTAESPFLTAWLARGWAGKAEAFLNHGVLDEDYNKVGPGLKEILKPIDNLDDFRAYLVAKRAQELLTKRGMPLEKSLGVGFTQADVDQVVTDGDGKYATAQQALVQYQDAVLQELVKAGVIDQEGVKAMRGANEQYIPFFRVMDPSAGTFNFRGAKSFVNLQNPVVRLQGSGRTIVDPLESVVKNTYALLNVAERNKVGRSLVELAEKTNGMGRLIEKVDAPMRPIKFQLDRVKGELEKAGVDTDTIDLDHMVMLFEQTGTPSAKNNQITVFRNGTKEFYQVDEELYQAVLAVDSQKAEWLVKMLSYPASVLRAGAVLNPEFQANNPLKDQVTAYVFSDNGYKPGVDLARGLFHVLGKSDLYYKWQASGGSQASQASMDRESLQGALDALTKKPSVAGTLLYPLRHPIETLRIVSEVMENATRLGEFARGVAKEGSTGEGIRRASLGARDVTIDFSRSGSHTKGINKARAFFNAAVQGTDKTVRAFKAHPLRTAGRAATAFTLPTILLYLLNRNNPWWQEKDEWQKDAFWFIPLPFAGTDAQGNAKHFMWIPRAHGLGMVFAAGPERILRWMDKRDKKDLDGFALRTLESVLPTSAREGFFPVPTGIVPLWEQISNRNMFTDAPIVPLKEQRWEPELQYGNSTSETAKLLGRVGASPRRVDHLVRGYAAGLGTNVVQLMDEALVRTGVAKIAPRPAKGLAAVPVLKTFLRDAGGAGSGSTVDQFYEVLVKAETMKSSQKQRATMGIDFRKFTDKEQQLLDSLPTLRKVDKSMQEMRGERLAVERSKDMSPGNKRRKIDELDLELTNLARWVFDKPPISD